jgi:hypothetical protein
MPNHSELLDGSDLHYAKAKLFTGSPTEITPDFAGQILMDGLGRMFVAASESIGDLVQVIGNANVGNGNGGVASGNIIFGNGRPFAIPESRGLHYVDLDTRISYYALHANSVNGWISSKLLTQLSITLDNQSVIPNSDLIGFRIFYTDASADFIESAPFDFGDHGRLALEVRLIDFWDWGNPNQRIDIISVLNQNWHGAYGFQFLLAGNQVQSSIRLDADMVDGTISGLQMRRNSPFDLFFDGELISKTYLLAHDLTAIDRAIPITINDVL